MDILTGQVSLAGEDASMGAKRRKYTPAYRRDAARLVIDSGRTIAEVAREIGVGEQVGDVGGPDPVQLALIEPPFHQVGQTPGVGIRDRG